MIIYAIKVENIEIASLLNFIKYICAPHSKTEVHLSVRGPYQKKISSIKIQKYNEIIRNSFILVNEAGNFFDDNQNTVFVRCNSDDIEKIWHKTDFGYNPHLTIYDGDDNEFANQLYCMLRDLNIRFSFKASDLIFYDTSKLNSSLLLTMGINNDIIKKHFNAKWQNFNFNSMPQKVKLDLIKRCFQILSKESLKYHQEAICVL